MTARKPGSTRKVRMPPLSPEQFVKVCEALPRDARGCQNYPTLQAQGYAYANVKGYSSSRGNRIRLAMALGRDLAAGMYACHSCDNKACVAIEHLHEGTPAQNSVDSVTRECSPTGEKHYRKIRPDSRLDMHGACNPSAKLSLEQVRELRARVRRRGDIQRWSRELGLGRNTVSEIIRGIRYRGI